MAGTKIIVMVIKIHHGLPEVTIRPLQYILERPGNTSFLRRLRSIALIHGRFWNLSFQGRGQLNSLVSVGSPYWLVST